MAIYLAADAIHSGELRGVLPEYLLPKQEINVVFPSPRFVPAKVLTLIAFLQRRFRGDWWADRSASEAPPSRAIPARNNCY